MKLNKKGFTLIELLVVIAIMGVLGSTIYAPFNQARKKGRDGKRVSEVKTIQAALSLYNDSNGGCLPIDARIYNKATDIPSSLTTDNYKYISKTLADRIFSEPSINNIGVWTVNKPYFYRSIGNANCKYDSPIDDSQMFFSGYQLYVELESNEGVLSEDSDNNFSTTLSDVHAGHYGLDLSSPNLELCRDDNAGVWDCVYDVGEPGRYEDIQNHIDPINSSSI